MSNMIELSDLVAPKRRLYHDSSFLTPQQIAMSSQAPVFIPSPNGAMAGLSASLSPLQMVAVAGNSPNSLEDMSGRNTRALYFAQLREALETERQARIDEENRIKSIEAERDRLARRIRDREDALQAQNDRIFQQQMEQATAREIAKLDLIRHQEALATANRRRQDQQQLRLEAQRRDFENRAVNAEINQKNFNQQLDAARWRQKQQDEMLRQAREERSIQAAVEAVQNMPKQPVKSSMSQTQTVPPQSSRILPEGGSPVMDLTPSVMQTPPAEQSHSQVAPVENSVAPMLEISESMSDYPENSAAGLFKMGAIAGIAVLGLYALLGD